MTKTSSTHIEGELSIHTENIFPVIKKWLYSDHEIFLRELISNAFDAITKLHKIGVSEKLEFKLSDGVINIKTDVEKKTLTISDNGVGLDADEVQKYINQIAFSGAEDFLKKYSDKDEASQIIGHFGLGFYSAFMVASKVEIISKSYRPKANAIHWECDGSTRFSLDETEKPEVGTDIVLHITEDNESFLTEGRIEELIKKFSNFLPLDIQVNGKTVNDKHPIWIQKPTELTKEDYLAFYQKLYPFSPDPLFWIHLNVDFPFTLKGILYFPKLVHEMDIQRGSVKLFCHQVFVTDNAKEVLPEFLTMLRGTIDCPDLPLNVSRSYLQQDPYVRKIATHIVKKVADRLVELSKKEPAELESFWDDLHPFVKFGMMSDGDFYEKVKDIVIFKSSEQAFTTLSAYQERNKEKLGESVIYSADPTTQQSYVTMLKEHGIEVLFLSGLIDTHFIQFVESKNTGVKFKAVDADIAEHLIHPEESKKEDASESEADQHLKSLFESALGDPKTTIRVEALKSDKLPALMIQPETIRRMKEMSVSMQQKLPDSMFDNTTLVVNRNHPIVQRLNSPENAIANAETTLICQSIADLARMSQKPLTGDQLERHIETTMKLLALLVEKGRPYAK